MSVTLFYNVGQSDILIDGKDKTGFCITGTGGLPDFRRPTQEVYETLSEGNPRVDASGLFIKKGLRVDFPILHQISRYLEQNDMDFDHIVLFASDQQGSYQVTDTLYVALLMKMFLNKRKPRARTEVVHVTSNPTDYDAMMQFYAGFVEQHTAEIQGSFRNILPLAPGTPACTFGLMMGFLPYLANSYPLYIPRKGHPVKVSIMSELAREQYRNLLRRAVQAYDYEGAIRILESANFRDESLKYLFSALHQRLNFRFDAALVQLRKFQERLNTPLIEYERSFFELSKGNRKSEIVELFYGIEISFKKRKFLEGVALVFRLQEAVLIQIVEDLLGTEIKKENGRFPGFESAIRACSELDGYLQKKGIRYEPTRLLLMLIVQYFHDQEKDVGRKQRLKTTLDFCSAVGEISEDVHAQPKGHFTLGDLRNASPFGHGFGGINEEDIECAYHGGTSRLLEDTRTFLSVNTGEVDANFYDRINEELLERIGELV